MAKKAIDEHLQQIDRTMDATMSTLYAADAHGSYRDFGMSPKEFEAQARKRIEKLVEKKRGLLDNKALERIMHDYKDRFRGFEEFSSHFTPEEREKVFQLAKERQISLEKAAYGLRAGTSRN